MENNLTDLTRLMFKHRILCKAIKKQREKLKPDLDLIETYDNIRSNVELELLQQVPDDYQFNF